MSLPEPLSQQIQRALTHHITEADAQRVIIEPLLAWLGYDIYDLAQVAEQVAVEGAGRGAFAGSIDYALRIRGKTYALVEAKVPSGTKASLLEDRQAVQQINSYCYSHPDRPRWGVLTNGLTWVIFDAQATGDVFKRAILTVDILSEPDLLRALSPAWSGHLSRFADLLAEARGTPSETIRDRAMRDILREYRETFSGPTAPAEVGGHPERPGRTKRAAPPPTGAQRGRATASYVQLPTSGGKPTLLLLPSGQVAVSAWTAVLVETAEYLIRKGVLRNDVAIPWTSRALLATGPAPEMFKPRILSNGWRLETNWSASHIVRLAGDLLQACGERSDAFTVEYEVGSPNPEPKVVQLRSR